LADTGQAMAVRDAFFEKWQLAFPNVPPIKDQLNGRAFPNRWTRIHSLPHSKRYPDTASEWDILLHRQNTVIDSLVAQNTSIEIVFNWIEPDNYLFKSFNLVPLGIIQLASGEPEYNSFLWETTWESHTLNPFLMMIAHEDVRAFILAPDCLIGPYDGGLDVILEDAHTNYAFRRRFSDWLSARPDGL
jgi:hypothetical protein